MCLEWIHIRSEPHPQAHSPSFSVLSVHVEKVSMESWKAGNGPGGRGYLHSIIDKSVPASITQWNYCDSYTSIHVMCLFLCTFHSQQLCVTVSFMVSLPSLSFKFIVLHVHEHYVETQSWATSISASPTLWNVTTEENHQGEKNIATYHKTEIEGGRGEGRMVDIAKVLASCCMCSLACRLSYL